MSIQQNIQDPKQVLIDNQSSKRVIFSYLATFALGMVASEALFQTSSNQEFNESKFLQKLWMSNQFQNFTWNTTKDIDYNQTGAGFSDIFVSPSGEIFGIQSAIIPRQRVSRAYKYNPEYDNWENAFHGFNTKKISFDSEGNFYLIDQNNTLYAKNSLSKVLWPCVKDVAPKPNGTLFVIQNDQECTFNRSYDNFTKIDITAGCDGSLWILDCVLNNIGSLQKFNNQTKRFEGGYNISAQRVEAYNEISVALLKDGKITYSVIGNQNQNFTNTPYAFTQ